MKKHIPSVIAFTLSLLVHGAVLFFRIPVTGTMAATAEGGEFVLIDAVMAAPVVSSDEPVASSEPAQDPAETEPEPEPEPAEELNEAVRLSEEEAQERQNSEPAQQQASAPVISQYPGEEEQAAASGEEHFLPRYRVDRLPEIIYRPRLEYPDRARRLNLEGSVLIEIDVDEDGVLQNARVITGAGYGFDEAALRHIAECRFQPAMVAGRPVACRNRMTIRFSLE
jgi:TonB family protein